MSPTLGQVLNQIKNTAGPVWDCGVLGLSADEKTGTLLKLFSKTGDKLKGKYLPFG